MIRYLLVILFLGLSIVVKSQVDITGLTWPRDITHENGILTIYQPQLESLEQDVLSGRMAVSHKMSNEDELVFGALWFSARMETDTEERILILQSIDISQTGFPMLIRKRLNNLRVGLKKRLKAWI